MLNFGYFPRIYSAKCPLPLLNAYRERFAQFHFWRLISGMKADFIAALWAGELF